MEKNELPAHEIEIRDNLQNAIIRNLANYQEMLDNHSQIVHSNGEENAIKNEIERLRILGEKFEGMWVVLDNEGFPMWPTVSLDEETAIARMVKLGPDKPWQYYLDKGHTVQPVTITIKKEK